MKITQAKWQDATHPLCRAVVDGVTMSVPEGSPHWSYLEKAIAEGLVIEEVDPEPTAEARKDAEAIVAIDGSKVLKALVIWLAPKVGKTAAQARDEIVAIYK